MCATPPSTISAGTVEVPVLLGGPSGTASNSTVTVHYATHDGTALAGTDYTSTSGTLTFGPGETAENITVPIIDRSGTAPTRRFTVTLSSPTAATIVDGTGVVTIGASGATPLALPDISAPPDVVVGEADGYVTLPVTLSAPGTKTVSVKYTTVNGTATASTGCPYNYVEVSGTLVYVPGETTEVVRVDLLNCDLANPGTFKLELSTAVNGTIVRSTVIINLVETPSVPDAPTDVSAVAGNHSATVYFATPVSDGGLPINTYTVTAEPGGATASGPGPWITVTGLTDGVTYSFTVTATNTVGTGPASASSNVVVPTAPSFSVTTKSLASGTVGLAYNATLSASGGTGPYTWSISTGSLPGGLTLDATTGAITGTPTHAGTSSFTVKATDAVTGTATATLSLAVAKGTAAVSATAKPSSTTFGDAVTYSATVSGGGAAPGGTVTFTTGTVALCHGTISSGKVTCTASSAPGGTDTITATYGGDANYLSAHSTTSLTVAKASTTTTEVGADPSSTTTGTSVTYSATVSSAAGTPGGTVAFKVGATSLCSGPVNGSGLASCSSSSAPLGTDTVTATYGGSTDYSGSSGTGSVVVNPAPLSVTTKSLASGTVGLAYNATLSASGGTGPYTWSISTGSLPGGLTLDATTGAITGTPTHAGTSRFTVKATDAVTGTATATLSLAVAKGTAAVSATAKPSSTTFGDAVTYSATVSGGGAAPGGTVTFTTGTVALCHGTISSGKVTCTASSAPGGTDTITATYGGDANYLSAHSTTSLTVAKASTTTTEVGADPSSTTTGTSVTYSATVSSAAGTPGGTVAFKVGATSLCSGPVNGSGLASCSSSSAPLGTDTVTATYGGSTDYSGSSGTGSVVVNPAPPPPPPSSTPGYDMVGADGGIFVFPTGQSGGYYGSLPGLGVKVGDIKGMVPSPDDRGYYLVGADGGVFAFGDARFANSLPGLGDHVGNVVGIVPTSDDGGYFLVGSDGGVFAFGDAPFLGSLPGDGVHRADIIGIAATPNDQGYWVIAADGTVYAFGSAPQLGSVSGSSSPVTGIASTPDGRGYWVVTQNGGVYAFGDATSFGSLPQSGVTPAKPVIGLVPTSDDKGYWLIGSDGGIFAYGDAAFEGSLPSVGVSVTDVVGAVPT